MRPKPNAPVHWVKPKIVVQVKFLEWTRSGVMRHPILLGVRSDKAPQEVVREKEVPIERVKREKHASGAVRSVRISHPDKIFWPQEGYTKNDLVGYYRALHSIILPYLRDRPQNMHRYPDGIRGEHFYQKNYRDQAPPRVETVTITSESEERAIRYVLCQNAETLLWLVNLGCIELNPWNSRIQSLERPDYLVIDLDPEEISFAKVIETAEAVHRFFERFEIPNYCKTSGATGLHIYVPLGAKYTYGQVRIFGEIVSRLIQAEVPEIASVQRKPGKRRKKVYVDFLQNRFGQTLASPYSVRPRPKAPVSTPLKWSEVQRRLDPSAFTMKNTLQRVERVGDLWKPVLGSGIDLKRALANITALTRR